MMTVVTVMLRRRTRRRSASRPGKRVGMRAACLGGVKNVWVMGACLDGRQSVTEHGWMAMQGARQ